jgi:general secretion pathway protein I
VREDGFTLVEVLVALAVLAIAMSALSRALSGGVDLAAGLRERTAASWVAEDRLTRYRLEPVHANGQLSGDASMAGQPFRWTLAAASGPSANLLRVRVRVFTPAGALRSELSSWVRRS